MKLNVLLAKTDHLNAVFKNAIGDYIKFFKTSQGAFKGEKKTYEAIPGTIDQPNQRGNKLVVTTVTEKLKWLQENSKEFIDALFSQEATNASGTAIAELMVDGKSMGKYSSLELLRLKSILEKSSLKDMYEGLPVRNDDETWKKTTNDMYTDKDVFESNLLEGVMKTTVKEHYILPDPNIGKGDMKNYTPQIAQKDTTVELGQYTLQRFSGETSHLERAMILQRRSKMLSGVLEALKVANDADIVESQMTSDKLFNYLHKGEL